MTNKVSSLNEIFRKTLNSHGYGFQYAVIREAQRLREEGKSEWIFEVSEFPVSVRGKNTHIDLILRKHNTRYHLIGECKRANPALANWCFVRSPYIRRNRTSQKLFFQYVLPATSNVATGVDTGSSDKIYNIGLEAPSGMKGDVQGQGRKVIEDAVTQVTLGVNGMIDFLPAHSSFAPPQEKIHLIPVIFTTANLWTTEVDLGSASLETGEPDQLALSCRSTSMSRTRAAAFDELGQFMASATSTSSFHSPRRRTRPRVTEALIASQPLRVPKLDHLRMGNPAQLFDKSHHRGNVDVRCVSSASSDSESRRAPLDNAHDADSGANSALRFLHITLLTIKNLVNIQESSCCSRNHRTRSAPLPYPVLVPSICRTPIENLALYAPERFDS